MKRRLSILLMISILFWGVSIISVQNDGRVRIEIDAVTGATAKQIKPKPASPANPAAEQPPIAETKTPDQSKDHPWSSLPSAWAAKEISRAASLGLGDDALMSQFNRPITREQFIHLLIKLYENSGGEILPVSSTDPFRDTKSIDVNKAYQLGIVFGDGQSNFNPDGLLTRQEAAVFLYREWKKIGSPMVIQPAKQVIFADDQKIAQWAREAIQSMHQIGIIAGAGNGAMDPLGLVTREQSLVLMVRSHEHSAFKPPLVTDASVH